VTDQPKRDTFPAWLLPFLLGVALGALGWWGLN